VWGIIALAAVFTMAALAANFVLFAGSREVVDPLAGRSGDSGQASGEPPGKVWRNCNIPAPTLRN
jgi:hypothetical protein